MQKPGRSEQERDVEALDILKKMKIDLDHLDLSQCDDHARKFFEELQKTRKVIYDWKTETVYIDDPNKLYGLSHLQFFEIAAREGQLTSGDAIVVLEYSDIPVRIVHAVGEEGTFESQKEFSNFLGDVSGAVKAVRDRANETLSLAQ